MSDRNATLPDAVALQLEAVQRSIGVAAIVFWSAWQTRQEMEEATEPVKRIDIVEFLEAVDSLL